MTEQDQKLFIISIIVGVLSFLAIFAILASQKKPVYKKRGQLLLLNEQRFFKALMQAIPPDVIAVAKVRLLEIVSVTDAGDGRNLNPVLADYAVDFVLVDRETSEVRLCIEMDAESQTPGERLAKNTMISRALRRAGIPHLRLPLVRYYDPARLRPVLLQAMKEKPASSV